MADLIQIDGSTCEGGGQILRTACSLSAITKKPCRVFNIRRNRPKPGLMPQHLLGIQALARLCHGRIEGAQPGSEEIKFYPGEMYRGEVSVKIPTAGSITLLLQTLVPPALFARLPVKIVLRGGATDTFFAPTADYFSHVFLRILEKMGARIKLDVLRRGYYPQGGAESEINIQPSELKALRLTERGAFIKVLAISGASESLKEKKVAERQLQGVREILGKLKLPIEERVDYSPAPCPGSRVCLVAEFENTVLGTDGLGKLGKRAEDIGREAALELLKEQKNDSCSDKHLADQIVPYLALTSGKSRITVAGVTGHCQTNMWVTERFLDGEFKIQNKTILWNPS